LASTFDGVLADFNTAYVGLFEKLTGVNKFPPDWKEQLDKTFPTCWNYEKLAGYTSEEVKAVWASIKGDPEFWYSLEPYGEVPSVCRSLNLFIEGREAEAYFITHRMGTNVKFQTETWLRDLGIEIPTVLIAGDKTPIINSLELDAYIDDKPETVEQAVAQTKARVYLMNRPYNQEVGVGTRVRSVSEMLKGEGLWES
jgi:hypothetical protein